MNCVEAVNELMGPWTQMTGEQGHRLPGGCWRGCWCQRGKHWTQPLIQLKDPAAAILLFLPQHHFPLSIRAFPSTILPLIIPLALWNHIPWATTLSPHLQPNSAKGRLNTTDVLSDSSPPILALAWPLATLAFHSTTAPNCSIVMIDDEIYVTKSSGSSPSFPWIHQQHLMVVLPISSQITFSSLGFQNTTFFWFSSYL